MSSDDVYEDEYFCWSKAKASKNAKKHKITFQHACAVFRDTLAEHIVDDRADYGEERWNVTGHDNNANVLVVSYTWRGGKQRIISARKAEPDEEREFLSSVL